MGVEDRRLGIVAQGGLGARQRLEGLMGQSAVNRAHAVGPLGMAGPGIMGNKALVSEKESGHEWGPARGWGDFSTMLPQTPGSTNPVGKRLLAAAGDGDAGENGRDGG